VSSWIKSRIEYRGRVISSILKRSIFEVGQFEVGTAEISTAEVGIAEVDIHEVGSVEVGTGEVGIAEELQDTTHLDSIASHLEALRLEAEAEARAEFKASYIARLEKA